MKKKMEVLQNVKVPKMVTRVKEVREHCSKVCKIIKCSKQ